MQRKLIANQDEGERLRELNPTGVLALSALYVYPSDVTVWRNARVAFYPIGGIKILPCFDLALIISYNDLVIINFEYTKG